MINRALISVYDKEGIVEFAHKLREMGIELLSSGGTFHTLREAGVQVTAVEDLTGFPEILGGRVKTLHPKVHGGILARRENTDDRNQLKENGIPLIDLVVINLYPFEATVNSGASFEDCIEKIDIGGPAMMRAAAKNHKDVCVVCDPLDYDRVAEELKSDDALTDATRRELARKVFAVTARYDSLIEDFLAKGKEETALPSSLQLNVPQVQVLRYGENPHQEAALYGGFYETFKHIHGKELSYNNIVDIQAAAELVEEFDEPACAIIKHTNPCGCATGEDLLSAYEKALATDKLSAFGGIICVNRAIDKSFAEKLNEIFSEVIIAPSYNDDARSILEQKKNRRLMIQRTRVGGLAPFDVKTIANAYLCQTRDVESDVDWKVVSKRQPTDVETRAMLFAWKIVKHVKSNAIIYTNDSQTLAIGAGQMSRVDSCEIATLKAKKAGIELQGSVVASDAFFPFADGLLEAIKAGATAAVEPGGSVRDEEVIEAANEHGIALVFTGVRHFKH